MVLGCVLSFWEGFGMCIVTLEGFWDVYCHSGMVLGYVLSLCNGFRMCIVTLGRFWDVYYHSEKV